MLEGLIGAAALLVAVLLTARLAFLPPPLAGRSHSRAMPASDRTTLGRAAAAAVPDPALSGIELLNDGRAAFAARMDLIRAAEESLDIQYYIWQRDATGLALLGEVQRAADRGVRVRLLIDDHGSPALDRDLAILDTHPMIEVRLFNPFILRRGRFLGFLFDFARLNRRMHNKSLTADGAATIVGGRNIGDIYFAFGEGTHYVDLDVLCVGRIAAGVARDFDRYWSSASAHPASRILWRPGADGWQRLAASASEAVTHPEAEPYFTTLADSGSVVGRLLEGRADLDCVPVSLVSDHPAKGLGRARREQMLYHRLVALTGQPARSVDLISAYFVPGREFTRALRALAGRGRRVRVLTNSQQATDVLVVHSAYVRYRPRLLRAGVELYELKADAQPTAQQQAERAVRRRAVIGSSRSSLHSKSLAIDEQRVFIGSFNFDHRSLDLNTEMGVLIDSPRLGALIARGFEENVRPASFRPREVDGRLVWDDPGPPARLHRVEPDTTRFSRALLVMLGWLPIEWLL